MEFSPDMTVVCDVRQAREDHIGQKYLPLNKTQNIYFTPELINFVLFILRNNKY